MAELKLNTTSSIVDYLKSTGKPSDFSSRENLYKSSGLEDRLGKYVGSSSQNNAFLKTLQTAPKTPVETTDASTVSTPTTTTLASGVTTTAKQPAAPAAPPTVGNSGITATDALASIPGVPSADDILGKVFASPGFQNFKEQQSLAGNLAIGSAEAEKAKLESQMSADTKKFIDSMGRRGLFFSGETQTGIASLAESLASSKLGVDRELAGKLLGADLKTQERIISDVESIVKDANAGRKEALDALNDVGLTVINGQVVPTLAAQREERAIASEERQAETAEFNRKATEERLRLAEEAAVRAEARLQLAEDKAAGNGVVTSGGLRVSNTAVGEAAGILNAARGADGWTDPNKYETLFYDWINKGGLPQDFTKAFPPEVYINPENSTILPLLRNDKSNQFGSLF